MLGINNGICCMRQTTLEHNEQFDDDDDDDGEDDDNDDDNDDDADEADDLQSLMVNCNTLSQAIYTIHKHIQENK